MNSNDSTLQHSQIIALYENGLSVRQIAQETALSRETIRKILKFNKIKMRRTGRYPKYKNINTEQLITYTRTKYIGIYFKYNLYYAIIENAPNQYLIINKHKNINNTICSYNNYVSNSNLTGLRGALIIP